MEQQENKHKLLKPLLTILIGILLVAGTGFGVWYWQQWEIKNQKSDSDSKIAALQKQIDEAKKNQAANTTTKESTNKTYTSNFGYSITYPTSADYKDITEERNLELEEIQKRGGGVGGLYPKNVVIFGEKGEILNNQTSKDMNYLVSFDVIEGMTKDDYALPIDDVDSKYSDIVINGETWRKEERIFNDDTDDTLFYLFERSGNLYRITIPGKVVHDKTKLALANKIVEGFKFK